MIPCLLGDSLLPPTPACCHLVGCIACGFPLKCILGLSPSVFIDTSLVHATTLLYSSLRNVLPCLPYPPRQPESACPSLASQPAGLRIKPALLDVMLACSLACCPQCAHPGAPMGLSCDRTELSLMLTSAQRGGGM